MKSSVLLFFFFFNFAHAYTDVTFAERISAKFIISGYKCMGDEFTVAKMFGRWADYKCTSKEWLIAIDPDESENAGNFITVKLKENQVRKSEFYSYYNIIPTMPIDPKARWLLKRHLVRFSPDGEIKIVNKQ
jgi:hypothetical protein